ncbi:immunoglobulin kappa light chain-like isoform X3 [Myxocyprinus asiaticus]|uniref:immunoglobulin kappa light chain-like isoform X3 n=1 Tax=Myxocyprinus asiaticus TaxID=70543 RepID=UPI002221630B|nr:immunoglobulin kappa light chain-like isoform X3 [Myxocyprinus asiaticus]
MMFVYIYILLFSEISVVLGVTVEQGQKTLVKYESKTSYLTCKVTGLESSNYIHWYQKREGEPISRLLYISADGGLTHDNNNPQAKDFTVDKTQLYNLKLSNTKAIHAAVYYCAYWDTSSNWIKRFGSGTQLIVTDQGSTVPPKVSVYPLSSAEKNGKSAMICQAKGMIPDLVELLWEKKTTEGWTTVSQDNVVEQKNEKPQTTVTSMVIVDKNTAQNNIYRCSVTHEGFKNKREHYELTKDEKEPEGETQGGTQIMSTCAPSTEKTQNQISDTLDQTHSLSLFVYAYGVMLMKNGIYFCAVFIFLLKRKAGKKDASS